MRCCLHGMTRTFISLEMNEHLQSHLVGVIRQVAQVLPGVRWVDPAGIHLTLAFLGELTNEQLAEAIEATETVAQHSEGFSYRLARLGIFGPVHRPRTIWMGIDEPTGALSHLYRALNRELERRGFEVDKRPFSPHLTLARIKSPLAPDELHRLQHLLQGKQYGIASSQFYPVQHLDVMKSELLPAGARCTCLRECVLSGA